MITGWVQPRQRAAAPGQRADDPHRALRVHERRGAKRKPRAAGHAVLEHERGDADRIQPRRDVGAFAVDGEYIVPAPRRDHDG